MRHITRMGQYIRFNRSAHHICLDYKLMQEGEGEGRVVLSRSRMGSRAGQQTVPREGRRMGTLFSSEAYGSLFLYSSYSNSISSAEEQSITIQDKVVRRRSRSTVLGVCWWPPTGCCQHSLSLDWDLRAATWYSRHSGHRPVDKLQQSSDVMPTFFIRNRIQNVGHKLCWIWE